MSWSQGAIRSPLDSKSNDGHPRRQDSGGGGEQWQRAEMTGDNGKHAGNERESNELDSPMPVGANRPTANMCTFHRSVRKWKAPITAPVVSHALARRAYRSRSCPVRYEFIIACASSARRTNIQSPRPEQ